MVKTFSQSEFEEERDLPVYTAGELFGKNQEVIIKQGEKRYRLRITKAGKLVLNK